MAKRISSEQFLKIIKAHDFNFISKSGSHAKYRNSQGKTVIIPHPRKDIPIGTLRSMIRQSGLPSELFDWHALRTHHLLEQGRQRLPRRGPSALKTEH